MHEGHRERLKKRFIDEGLDSFKQHQILELLLFYSIPRKDTNETAHLLLNEFGSLSKVLEADVNDLVKVKGVGKNTAILLTLIPSLARIYFQDRWGEKPVLDSSIKAGEYAASLFVGRNYEVFYVICLDSQNRMNYAELVHKGTINEAPIYPRIIVETALKHKAAAVILCHNHPGGSLRPSRADIQATKVICDAMKSISINVIDHFIIAGDKYFSFAEKGLI